MSNPKRSVLYLGVTSNLENRVWQHKNHYYKNSFSSKYNCTDLIYYKELTDINDAIKREKEIKKWGRSKKNSLIVKLNPNLTDLSQSFNL